MILSLRIAVKFYQGFSNNSLISLMSLISIVSIALGIAISIISLSIIHGFENELSKRILTIIPHVEIKPINVSYIDWKKTLIHIRKIPNIVNVNFYIDYSGIIQFYNKWHAIYIRSIDTENNLRENELFNFLSKDQWEDFCSNKEKILLGQGVSDILKVKTGDWITILITPYNHSNSPVVSSNRVRLQVSGIFNLHSQWDRNLAIISLSNARCYSNNKLNAEGISVKVHDMFNVNKVISDIKEVLTEHVYISNWKDTYGYIYRDIQIVRIIIYLTAIFIIGIICFNVMSIFILLIKEKNYDVVILRILGAKNILVQYIFFWYGLIIYVISSVIGLGLGVMCTLVLTKLSIQYNDTLKKNFFSEKVYFIDFLPAKLNCWDIFIILGSILLIGTIVSWYLALKVKNLNLSQVLKQ